MSLKHFHIVFIVFAFLCDGGFFLWTHLEREQAAEMGATSLGMFSGWIALAIVVYGLWYVFKKCKTIHVET